MGQLEGGGWELTVNEHQELSLEKLFFPYFISAARKECPINKAFRFYSVAKEWRWGAHILKAPPSSGAVRVVGVL